MSNAVLRSVEPEGTPTEQRLLEQDIFTIREAAVFLRVGRKQIDAAIRQRRLKVIQLTRFRRAIRIYKQDLLELRGFAR